MDDLLDLTWQPSSASHSSTQPSQPSKSAYKPPNYHTPPLSSSPAPAPAPSKAVPAPAPATATADTDAFSSLFAPSSSSSTKQQANLSLAQRQQLAQQQARNKADDEKRRNDALWSGIDSSAWIQPAAASRPSSAANAARPTTQPSDPWDFDSFTAPSSKPSAPALTTTQPTPTKLHSTTAAANNDPFDFDGFQPSLPAPTAAHVDQSDDILGALAMPVSELKPSRPHDHRVAALSSSASASSSADSSRGKARQAAAPPTAGVAAAAAAAAMSSAASALFGARRDEAASISRQHSPAGASPQLPTRPAAAPKAAYASPHRRGPTRSSTASPAPPTALKRRAIPREASHTISSAARNKDEGNDHFRRGAYADAEASYTRGIAALESSSFDSVRLVPLLSNRANVRLKNGDTAGTIGDCDRLVGIVLAPFGGGERDASGRVAVYRPSQEADLPAELGDVKLRETFGKALVRRAQALEASERWKLARADWAVLLEYEQLEGSGVRTTTSHLTFARQGMERCSRMLNPTSRVAASQPKPKPAAPRRPPATASTGGVGGEASAAFAQQQQKAAVEESEKFALKDAVDAKIDAWKRGKETNLRALLSSLDTIVWPELGWKPIALHQVLDAAGLKKNYTRAIARLHPDKIQSSATTEHKMIAAAAFHALNEAWNASQS
ncbi:hypothetical protein PaG_00197 [Moesziomyces aphidis]|uniref:J domain-containing protein n=1 Tax=Moesziomyces aphidis TaxID=84754 RepID=W3VUB9_MOEAP|nr:hypothetical protein PaG_00197 [Moesziomyces aphidis]